MNLLGFRQRVSDRYDVENKQDSHNMPPSGDDIIIASATSALLNIPSEIILHILSYLESQHLVCLLRTCKQLRNAAEQPKLWRSLLRRHIPDADFPSSGPYPAPSYRELYLSHYPYWFLPRNKIWISDEAHVGKMILCKFDPRRGCIEGYRVLAKQGPVESLRWAHKPSVVIHTFSPRLHLWLDDPVLSFPYEISPSGLVRHQDGWHGELGMTIGSGGHSTSAAFFLSRAIPPEGQYPGMSIWPPRTIPGMPRVRAESIDKFKGKGHRPNNHDEISQTTFRMRHWSQFATGWARFGVKIGEETSTWSTIDPRLYTPTIDKPYQGIFVGDYSSHGCEFLLVMQTDKPPAQPYRQAPNEYLSLILRAIRHDAIDIDIDMSNIEDEIAASQVSAEQVEANVKNENAHKGAIEAVKLTGDPHVPRGEHTFIADDISDAGLIRIASEPPFRGARVVKSRGHIADQGFQNDYYIPSQLIMVDSDTLAQYWVPFSHISYYKRVNLDQLLSGTTYRRASG